MKGTILDFDELEWSGELEDEWEAESTFNFSAEGPSSVRNLLPPSGKKDEARECKAVAEAIRLGDRDENRLSDIVFFNRHPERNGRFIKRTDNNYKTASREWLAIRNELVRPLLAGGIGPVQGDTAATVPFKIVAKSYIAVVGTKLGSPTCLVSPPLPVPPPPGPAPAAAKLAAFGLITDVSYSENPLTDRQDHGYRLFTECTLNSTVRAGTLGVTASGLSTDVGLECIPYVGTCLNPPPLIVSPVTLRRISSSRVEFQWQAKGRPHLGAEPMLQGVCARTSVYIWHLVSGVVDAGSGIPTLSVRLTGSQFPSHRIFVNGVSVATIPQGPLANLWHATPGEPTRVR